jgi:hypothetical protein
MKYKVRVEYVPEASFDGIEWGWEAVVTGLHINQFYGVSEHSLSSKFGYATIEEARENMEDVLAGYLPALNQDRIETFTREV